MRSRTNLILLVVAVGLSVYVYFFEGGAPPGERKGRVFPDLEPSHLTEIEVERRFDPGAASVGIDTRPIRFRLEGAPAAWDIVSPIRFPAFHPRVISIAYDLADLVRLAVVPDGGRVFGAPQVTLRFKTRFGEDHTVEVGPDHPDPALDYCYVRQGGDVFIAPKGFKRNLTFTLSDVRSRTLFGISPSDALRLEVQEAGGRTKILSRREASSPWRLGVAGEVRADTELTQELLVALNAWTVERFVNDALGSEPKDLAPFGLDAPRIVASLLGQGERHATLEVGSDVPDAGGKLVYARAPGAPFLLAIPSDPLARLTESPELFRSRFALDFSPEEVVGLALSLPGRSRLELSRERTGAGWGPWKVAEEGGLSFPGDRERLDSLLVLLSRLLVLKFLDEPLASPAGKISLSLRGGAPSELGVGALEGSPGEEVHAATFRASAAGEPGSFVVELPFWEELLRGAPYLRERSFSELDAAQVLELEVQDGPVSWVLGRVPGEDWMLSTDSPARPGRELRSPLVESLLRGLDRSRFRAADFPDGPVDLVAEGLELASPARSLRIRRREGESPGFQRLLLGRSPPVGRGLARVDPGDIPPFVPERDLVRSFEDLAAHLRQITGAP